MRYCYLLTLMMAGMVAPGPLFSQIDELDWPIETVSGGHGFTEGAALAPDGSIYFSDMDQKQILRYDPGKGITEVWTPRSGRSNGLYIQGDFLYACEAEGRAVVRYDLKKGPSSREVLVSRFRGNRLGCPNDLAVVGSTLYFSEFWIDGFLRDTGGEREIFNNRVYALTEGMDDPDSLAFRFHTPNGIASSPDGSKLFIGDIGSNRLYRAHLYEEGPGRLQLITDLGRLGLEGPDGMAVAQDGRIFLALYNSDCLLVLQPDGTPIGTLPTGPLTSNCIFAADGKTLYITAEQKLKKVVVPPAEGSWKETFLNKLELMGHRNWILVVDKAFPEQSSPGISTLYVEQDLLPTLREVLEMLESATHVRPVVYRDRELEYLSDAEVPGIGEFKSRSSLLLAGHAVHSLLHEEVFTMLDQSSALFTTLVIKTSCTLPYTSVFMQLDCAYWGPEDEKALREKMNRE
jgi:sugar lactone lactonase YvrE